MIWITPWDWLNRYACVNQWEDVHSVAVVLRVFGFLINKACWPLFSYVVWKILNVAKFNELGEGIVDSKEEQKPHFWTSSAFFVNSWILNKLWNEPVGLSQTFRQAQLIYSYCKHYSLV